MGCLDITIEIWILFIVDGVRTITSILSLEMNIGVIIVEYYV